MIDVSLSEAGQMHLVQIRPSVWKSVSRVAISKLKAFKCKRWLMSVKYPERQDPVSGCKSLVCRSDEYRSAGHLPSIPGVCTLGGCCSANLHHPFRVRCHPGHCGSAAAARDRPRIHSLLEPSLGSHHSEHPDPHSCHGRPFCDG